MMHILTSVLLGLAVAVAVFFSLGMAIMSDAFERLHFGAVVAGISGPLIAVAVWIEDNDAQSRIKIILIVLLLLFTNAILSHATARAFRIRQEGHWELEPSEKIPIVGPDGKRAEET
jgi:multisubunit Na+/H+ antiporter MnhG subunit